MQERGMGNKKKEDATKPFLYVIFIAFINNIDNISVRIAYSVRGVRITSAKNLWIAVITFGISTCAAFSGTVLANVLSKQIASILSMLILSAIGIWFIMEPLIADKNKQANGHQHEQRKSIWHVLANPEHADMDNSKDIDFKEATLLGVALSLNNIGGGLGAGMIGLNALLVGFFSAVISFIALWAGNYITEIVLKGKLGNAATILAGLALIAIGVEQIL